MAVIILHIARDPRRLLEHAAEGFLHSVSSGRAGGLRGGAVQGELPFGGTPEAPVVADHIEPFPSPAYWLFLRQGGLRDDLLALAAERGVPGWFDPPVALLQELPTRLADLHRAPIDDFARSVLVARALRDADGPVFGRLPDPGAYTDAVDRWLGELLGEGIDPAGVEAALAGLPGRDGFARDRDAELLRTYVRYVELLEAADLRDPRARVVDCAAAVRDDPDAVARRLGGRREMRLVGLSDPRGGWPLLLRALRDCPALDRIAIYSADRHAFLEEIADEIEPMEPRVHFTTPLFTSLTAPAPAVRQAATLEEPDVANERAGSTAAMPRITIVSAPDLPREVEEIACRVRALIDAGVAPHDVAVIARSARPYTDHVVRSLRRLNVPVMARLRHPLPEVPAIRALLSLFRVAAEGWERHGLVELAETPYFRARLDAGVLNHIGYQRRLRGLDAWRDALQRLHHDAVERQKQLELDSHDEGARRDRLPPADRVEAAVVGFEQFARLALALDGTRSVAGWLDWLDRLVDQDEWGLGRTLYRAPNGRLDTVRLDTAAWLNVRRIVRTWRDAERRWGDDRSIDVRGFHGLLRTMLDGDAALFTPERRGVRVLEGLAAAFRSFQHVFIVGLDATRAPLRPPRSPLLDEHERAALREAGMRIDTRDEWTIRENELFRNLLATARATLTLSWARYDETGAEQLPSSFIEELELECDVVSEDIPGSRAFTPRTPLALDPSALATARRAVIAERARAAGESSPYHGCIEHDAMRAFLADELGESRVWSPTQLEAYAKCPWAWFSGRLLRLDRLEDPDLDIDPLTRGSILHDALRRFYDGLRERIGGPVFLRSADLDRVRPIAEGAIADAIDAARHRVWVGHPALEEQKLEELKRQLIAYIEWEAEQNDEAVENPRTDAARWVRMAVDEHEIEIDEAELIVDGERIRFRGFIDRVEVSIDERGGSEHMVAAVDYKSSTWSTPAGGRTAGWADGVVLQVPLYAHALTQIRPGTATARVEYRALRNRKRVHALAFYKHLKSGLVEDTGAREKYERALRDVLRHVRRARGGEFPPDPPPSCNCPPFCHARDICRIPGGPRK